MKINNTLYFDHNSTTPLDPDVLNIMLPFFCENFGNPHSAEHAMGWAAARAVDNARAQIAFLLGADEDEVIFTSGATEANNLALQGLALAASSKRSARKILYSAMEHKSIIETCCNLQKTGQADVLRIPVDSAGVVDLDFIKDHCGPDTLAVCVMAVSNEIGTIQPIEEVSKIARSKGVHFHCDATQGPCAIDLEMSASLADTISLSGHKMYGPKGIGVLYASRQSHRNLRPILFGGNQQLLRPGTISTPLCVGMGAAAALLEPEKARLERRRTKSLRDLLVSSLLSQSLDIRLNGPSDKRHPGNANLIFNGLSAHEILTSLQPRLAASTGSACTSGIIAASYVLRTIGLTEEEANSSIRFCVGRFTTENDVLEAVELLQPLLDGRKFY